MSPSPTRAASPGRPAAPTPSTSPTTGATAPAPAPRCLSGTACGQLCPPTPRPVRGDSHTPPAAMTAGTTPPVNVTFTNTGSLTWEAGGPNPVHLSYHWRNGACPGTSVSVWHGLRAALPADTPPGARGQPHPPRRHDRGHHAPRERDLHQHRQPHLGGRRPQPRPPLLPLAQRRLPRHLGVCLARPAGSSARRHPARCAGTATPPPPP